MQVLVDQEVNNSEKRCPHRLTWLTGRSTIRKNDILSFNLVDREVNIAGFG